MKRTKPAEFNLEPRGSSAARATVYHRTSTTASPLIGQPFGGLAKIMKKRIRTILMAGVGVLAIWLAANAAWNRYAFPKWLEPLRTRYQEEVSRIRVDDGVDSTEASEIAGLYMGEYISGCGAPEPPILRDGRWSVPLRLGYAGELSDKVVEIDAKNGAVSSNAGPKFSTFREFTKDLISGIAARRR